MAKPTTIKIRLNSSAGTGHFYVTKKNARTMTEKMVVPTLGSLDVINMKSYWFLAIGS